MARDIILDGILQELKEQGVSPLSTITTGDITYVTYGIMQVGNTAGYKVKKITAPANITTIEQGFLPEALRVSGANGSGTNVDLNNEANALLLLADASIIYG